jgi:2-polyprenyl-6-methoxyphenol hydroxylase-like FAD-dependent oxidoreductase
MNCDGQKKSIAVIGAGYSGTAFCLAALSRHLDQRFELTLFEQSPDPGPVGAGVLLQPSGQYVLKKLGLFTEEFRSQLHPYNRLRARDGVDNFFLDLSVSENGYQTYGAHRGTIYERLLSPLKRAAAEGRLGLQFGSTINRAEECPEGWRLYNDSQNLGLFDLVVVADGSDSQNRERLGFSCLRRTYKIGAIWCVGKSAQPNGELLQSCLGTSRIVGLLPTDRRGQVSFFFSCSGAEYEEILSRRFQDFVDQVREIAPEAVPLLQQAGGFDRMLHTQYQHGWMPTWIKPGAVVVGDAAHPMSPHLGQGVNLALLDAYSLAKSLDLSDLSAALHRYQKKRKGQVAMNSWLSLILTPFFQSYPDLGQGRLRNLGVRLFMGWPWMREQMRGAVWGRKAALWDLVDEFEEIC